MRWSQTLIPTLREDPADAATAAQRLLVRAGLVRQVAPAAGALLPLGVRVIEKAAGLLRDEIRGLRACEMRLPGIQPIAHSEMVAELAATCVTSYRQLPLMLLQVRNDAGVSYSDSSSLRLLGHASLEAYSLHADQSSLDVFHAEASGCFRRVAMACGLDCVLADAAQGSAFVFPCDVGRQVLLASDRGNFTATLESCRIGTRAHDLGGQPHGDPEKVHTPGSHSIDEVSALLNVPPQSVLKTVIYRAAPAAPGTQSPKWIVAVVRGDHDVNDTKLAMTAGKSFNVGWISLARDEDLKGIFAVGYVGPDAAMCEADAVLVIDPDAAQDRAWLAGANETDYHVRNFNWFRDAGDRLADPTKALVADIRNAMSGDPSPLDDGGVLRQSRGIPLGRLFTYGSKYSAEARAQYVDEAGNRRDILMGSYSFDLIHLVAAVVEHSHDEAGIIWPAAIAPYSVCLTPIRYEGQTRDVADRLYTELNSAGVDTILDDRDARPGSKFADADLVGFPFRINIGERGLKTGQVELKRRSAREVELVPLDQVVRRLGHLLSR